MKHSVVISLVALVAIALAGCMSQAEEDLDPVSSAHLNVIVANTDVTALEFQVTCDSGITLEGNLNVIDDRTPPVWAAIMDLPVGVCTVTLVARDDTGASLCTGSRDVTVVENTTVKVDLVLVCLVDGDDPIGRLDIDATFEVVDGNLCPRLHFLNAVPSTIPDGGSSAISVLVSDADGDALTTALAATSGSFLDATALSTTYTCDGANGAQTISVTVSDGDATCDKSKSFPVACPGLVCEYEQDFEGLDPANSDALSNDGWLYFGNVFDGTGVFKFNFGPFPAPTTSGQISAIAIGEGGPDQGENQLVVFSNYDCCDPPNEGHFNGTDRVESVVFEEINPILATDIGRTFTFTFDAKRGNIAGSTTAQAFIKTIAGSNTTNNVVLDTANLPTNWGTYSITLDLNDTALVGQTLQFGFSTVASDFEGSGNFYDNISFCAPGGGNGDPGITLRPLPEIYTTGNAVNYSPYRAGGPGSEFPSDADILEDLALLRSAGYDLLRLFGGDAVSERILQLAAASFPEMQFQQGLFLEGLAPGPAQQNCDSTINDSQVATAIQLANTYSSVVTVSVGNETSFFAAFMPLNCLEGYITETRNNVAQPVTADDDYTFYANFFGRSPDGVLRLIDFVSIHTYPFLNYQQWDWKQEGVPAGPERAEAMMNASLVKAQQNYQAVYDYRYRNASGVTVTVGATRPIVVGETGWKWRQTTPTQEIEVYAALPVNAKWYTDLLQTWEGSPGGPVTIFPFEAFDEAWKTTDDGWGFWDELRQPNYVLCGTPAGSPCNVPLYQGAGYYTP